MKVLHLGSGRVGKALGPNWGTDITTLDADPRLEPDVVFRLGCPLPMPFADDTFDHIVAKHVLEHIGRQGQTDEWFWFWEELYRITKPNGALYFESPLYSSVWAWADPTHTRALCEESFTFFDQDNYRIPGSSISPYRIRCDWRVQNFYRLPDVNPHVMRHETNSHLSGVLLARKPLRVWWETPVAEAVCAK